MNAPTHFELEALDGYALGATLFEPAAPAQGTLLVHGATAVPQRFYRAFAGDLASRGIRVLTYDYRGVGRSRPASLRKHGPTRAATMTEWATLDARGAHRWLGKNFAKQPLAILGHSFGGQLLGLIDEARDVAGAVLVAAQMGYLGHWPLLARARLALLWRAVPAVTATFGYLPGRIGLGEDLPRGVANEWAAWCRHPDYLVSAHPDAADRFARFDRPTLYYTFTDDPFAPRRTVEALLARLRSAPLEHRRLHPHNLGGAPIGHFGYFRRPSRDSLWSDTAGFLTDVFAGRVPRRAEKARPTWDVKLDDIVRDLAR